MADETGEFSDEDLEGMFREVLDENDTVTDTDETVVTDLSPDPEPAVDVDPEPVHAELSSVERVLVVIKDGDDSDLRKFEEHISDDLDAIAGSDDESQMLVITLCNQKNPSDKLAVRTLTGLAYRRSQLKRDGKRVDYAKLNAQVRSCLAGKLAWDDIVLVEYVPETKTDVDPDMVEAGELAALLRCTVVDVLAFAGLNDGNDKTLVSRATVTSALETLEVRDEPADVSVDEGKPALFDQEEQGNQPEDDVVDVVVVQLPPATDRPSSEEPAKPVDDPAPITGYEYITVDPDDELTDLEDDWYVKSCRSLIEVLDS